MSTQKYVSTSVKNIEDRVITIRQCTQPTMKVIQICDLHNYKFVPFHKKTVVLPIEIFKNKSS